MGIRNYFRDRRISSIDKKAKELYEAGDKELAQELEEAREELEYATYRYERLEERRDYSEERKEALEDRLEEYKAKKREMTGIIPWPHRLIRRAIWRLGITKKGREFKKLERNIRTAQRILERMNKDGKRRWEEMIQAEEDMDRAEEKLQNIEKKIKKEYKERKRQGSLDRDEEITEKIENQDRVDEETRENIESQDRADDESRQDVESQDREDEETVEDIETEGRQENIENQDIINEETREDEYGLEILNRDKEQLEKALEEEKDPKIRRKIEKDLEKVKKEIAEKTELDNNNIEQDKNSKVINFDEYKEQKSAHGKFADSLKPPVDWNKEGINRGTIEELLQSKGIKGITPEEYITAYGIQKSNQAKDISMKEALNIVKQSKGNEKNEEQLKNYAKIGLEEFKLSEAYKQIQEKQAEKESSKHYQIQDKQAGVR